jgi:hypothetical protein
VTHRTGRGQGQPLSISNCVQGLASLKKTFPALRELHFHLLRHDWNYRFSKTADVSKIDPKKEAELRGILMGWDAESDMAKTYNARHVQEQALSIGLQVASATARPAPPSKETLAQAQNLVLAVANT